MILLITFLLIIPGIAWMATISMAVAGKICKIPIEEISFGTGKKLISFKVGETEINFRLIFLSAFCRFQNTEQEFGRPLLLEATRENYPDAFNFKPPLMRFLVVLAGPLFVFIIAFLICQNEALDEIVAGCRQLWKGTLSPIELMPDYFRKYVAFVNREGWISGFGLVAAKFAAAQLIPVPTNGIAQALLQLLPQKIQNRITGSAINALLMIAFMVIAIMWVIALLIVAFSKQ